MSRYLNGLGALFYIGLLFYYIDKKVIMYAAKDLVWIRPLMYTGLVLLLLLLI